MPVIKKIHYPKNYGEVNKIAIKYRKQGLVLVSLEKTENKKEAKRIKDYLLGVTYALKGFAFQYKKILLFSFIKRRDLKDCPQLRGWAW